MRDFSIDIIWAKLRWLSRLSVAGSATFWEVWTVC